ncbi:hypothetical protein [Amycolatopsis granulosa]|uniref:hypothetical protein n=1 Tax=Amycolatopsis granulosa TaxID=185684 RepID=UPI00141EB546|nr:hypothetical protein [Amycolatopsis granulosa]NIH86597.1 hypothetical protein [Amycolatopsis granulosa]
MAEFEKAEEDHDSLLIRAMWSSALVAYKRCFERGKRTGLTIEDVRSLALQGEVEGWHQFLLDMRDKHVAHSVNPFEEVRVGAIIDEEGHGVGAAFVSLFYMSATPEGVWQLGKLAHELLQLVRSRCETEFDVLAETVTQMSRESLAALRPLEHVIPAPETAGTPRPSV